MYSFYEFFAGGGMARMGLGPRWECIFANDCSAKKASAYTRNFPQDSPILLVEDVAKVKVSDLPGTPDLVWGSFPCQDLSLAGNGAGLQGERSGVFWPFWNLVRGLQRSGRSPTIVVLENVEGILTSHGGNDFRALVKAVCNAGFRLGAVTVDAVHFLPQSRPRIFFVAVRQDGRIPNRLMLDDSNSVPEIDNWHSESLITAHRALPNPLKSKWIWWRMSSPAKRRHSIQDLLEPESVVPWHSADATQRLLEMMSPLNIEKVKKAQKFGSPVVGTVYKRTRNGVQRAEVRFDGISGCLRTPGGGSSRQTILSVRGKDIRSRLLSPREAARLMGIPDSYILPKNYNEAYHIAGDGLAVPAVAWIESQILSPLMESIKQNTPLGKTSTFETGELAYA